MSRIGKLPIHIPQGVTVAVSRDNTVTVKGPKGQLSLFQPETASNAIRCCCSVICL